MDDVGVVDKLFEQRFGDQFREFAAANGDDPLRASSRKKLKRQRSSKQRNRFESPYQRYPPRKSLKDAGLNTLSISSNQSSMPGSTSFPAVFADSKKRKLSGTSPAIEVPEAEEKVPENGNERGRTTAVVVQPSVYELMQEIIPTPAFSNDQLIAKSLSLPYMEQLEYIKMHLERRGMYEAGHLHDIQKTQSEKIKLPGGVLPIQYVLPGYEPPASAATHAQGNEDDSGEENDTMFVEDVERSDPVDEMSTTEGNKEAATVAGAFSMHTAMKRYAHFTSFLECDRIVQPQRRQTSWLLEIIEEIYDERYRTEFTEYVSAAPPKHPLAALVPTQFVGLETGNNDTMEGPSMYTPVFVYHFLSKTFGLKVIVDQVCWDLLYTMSFIEEDFREVRIFSMFLREIWDENVMLFHLFCRNNLQSRFPVRFKLKKKLIDHVPMNHLMPGAITTQPHPMKIYGHTVLRLSQWACTQLLLIILDNNQELVDFILFELHKEFSPHIHCEHGRVVKKEISIYEAATKPPTIDANILLERFIQVFLSCPDDIIQSIKYSDPGGTLFMLTKLRQTAHCDEKVEAVRLRLIDEERNVQAQEVAVNKLKATNVDGANRTALFLAENELWRLQTIVTTSQKQLIEVRAEEDIIWDDVIGSDRAAAERVKKSKKKHSSVPSDLVNLDMAVQRFVQWIERKHKEHEKHLKVLGKLNLSWEEQMEKVRLKAIVRIQRKYRERQAARLAKEEADVLLNIRREKRKRENEARKAREEAIKKRRMDEERKHMERVNRQKREEEERLAKLKQRQLDIVHKHQQEEAERRFREHIHSIIRRRLNLWKKYTKTCILKKKVFRHEFKRRIDRWKRFADDCKDHRSRKEKAAHAIQRCFRAFHCRHILAHVMKYREKQNEMVRMNLVRLKRQLEHRVLKKWHAYAHQQHGIRKILRDHFSHVLHSRWHDWIKFTHDSVDEKNAAATKMQSIQRARMKRHEYLHNQKRRHAASLIQRSWRAKMARNILKNAKRHFEREERRAHRALARMAKGKEARVFHKWYDYYKKAKLVKKFLHDHMMQKDRKYFVIWTNYTTYTRNLKQAAALLVQKKYREMKFYRLIKIAVRKTRAATLIQTFARQYLQARTLEWLILYRDNATIIQKVVRGTQGRKEFVFRRQANYFKAAFKKDYWSCNKAFERNEGHLLDAEGNNMLMWAARGGSKRVIKLCLRHGMNINAINNSGENAMVQLIRANYLGQDVVLDYMLSKGATHKSQDFTGSSPLMEAARLGRIDCMKLLLNCDANINHTDYDGCSILQVAAAANQVQCVNLLLDLKVDVDHRDHDGSTVLHDVAARGAFHLLEHLLQYMTDINVADNEGYSALYYSIFGGHMECTRLLVLFGASTNLVDDIGRTQAHYAVENKNFELFTLLSEADTDLNIQDRDGQTPLHIAAKAGYGEMTKMLLGNGADPTLRDHEGNSALHLAAQGGHVEPIKSLIDYHASINFVNFDNRTPLGEARMRNHADAVKIFNTRFVDDKIAQRKFEVAFALNRNETPPPAPEEPVWFPKCRGLTVHQWEKVRELSSFKRKIHLWLEMEISFTNLDSVVKLPRVTDDHAHEDGEKKKFWEQSEELKEAIKTELAQVITYWYYDNDKVYSIDMPQDVEKGAWVEEEVKMMRYDAELDTEVPTGEHKMIWKNIVTGEISETLPPMIVKTKNTKRPRLHPVLGKADMTKNEYKAYYEKEMGDINLNRAQVQGCILIQKFFRGYRCRVYYAKHKKRWYASIVAQRLVRGFLGRCKARYRRQQARAATRIQAHYRAMIDRRWISANYAYMWRRRAIWTAVHLINRVWRGYLARRWKRRYLWKTRGPEFHEEWQEVRKLSGIRRVIGVWDEMIYVDTYDVIFYCNHLTYKCQWEKPLAIFNHDMQQIEDDKQLRLCGFTRKENEVAQKLQGIWRGRQAMRTFRQMVRGAKIMKTCENDFLSDPDKIENLCNYTLYLHAVRLEYDHARILYGRMLEYMVGRGPDNAFVLYAYAIFSTATREADFDDIMDMVMRARDAEPKTGAHCFDLAQKGFFKQAMVFQPKSAQANANYAICLQYVRQDYVQAEEYYLRACKLDPYDHSITANFNDMLKRLARKPYDGFEAFMASQKADAEKNMERLKLLIESDEYQLNKYKHDAAALIQRAFRRKKGVVKFWKFEGVPKSLQLAREHKEFYEAGGVEEEALEDIYDWEECGDGLGKTYFFNKKTNESRWSKPQFLQAGVKVPKGPGLDGMRIGRLENVDDWEECKDALGSVYYYNQKSGKSQWIRPRFKHDDDHPKKGMGFGDAQETAVTKEDLNNGGTEKRADWHEHKDGHGRVYWYNDKKGTSQWIQPHFMSEDVEIELHHQWMEEMSTNIPEGWEVQKDENNNYFYFCLATGESVWEKPTEAMPPPPPWETATSEDGTVYFYNPISGESRWELKSLMDYKRNKYTK